ncbi:MAG: hypothetical protein U5K28_08755 [Halobacteriales archaeon]|nr:hypothetical protein [Halobacteriales archaeon]
MSVTDSWVPALSGVVPSVWPVVAFWTTRWPAAGSVARRTVTVPLASGFSVSLAVTTARSSFVTVSCWVAAEPERFDDGVLSRLELAVPVVASQDQVNGL